MLPISEYAALRHAAFPAEAEPVPPAVEATLSRLDYKLKVDGDLASGEARLTVDVIREGWVRLPLPEGLMVRDAKLDGREVSLVTHATAKGPATAELLLSKTGRSVLTLGIVAQVSTVAGTDILQLPISNSAISHAVVEGQRVSPVTGADGSRVPLLRPGFIPSGAYTVSFVYLNSGARFARTGGYEMTLPKLDIPVNLLTWEVSLPDQLEVKQFGGNALSAELFPAAAQNFVVDGVDEFNEKDSVGWSERGG
ncbi:MAG: hypothetical protein ABR607_14655 [Pyrinomonadaceae bacterium]